jgi:multidrug resistance efflux pump
MENNNSQENKPHIISQGQAHNNSVYQSFNDSTFNNSDTHSFNNSSFNHSFIGNPPTYLMRSGITLIAFVIMVILIAAYYIKYPDKITAKGIVTAYHPPIEHYAKVPGIIDSLYVQDGMQVQKGMVLAYIENDMNVQDLTRLNAFIGSYESVSHVPQFLKIKIPYHLQLGELSDDYGRLVLEMEEFQSTLRQSGVFQQINTLKNEIVNNKRLQQVIQKDKTYTEEELALIEKDFGRNSTLNKEGVVSDLDREKSKGQLLQHQKSYNLTDQSLINNQIKSKQLELEVQKLSEERLVKVNQHIFTIKSTIHDLRKKQRIWEESYIIKAKTSGTASVKSGIAVDRYIKPDEAIATIVPTTGAKDKYVQLIVPSSSIGKIEKGTAAILRFDAYPYKEYGIVKTSVAKIALLLERNKEGKLLYEVHLHLREKIVTTYNHTIPCQPMASISADIITEDKSILERIFSQFLSLVKNE